MANTLDGGALRLGSHRMANTFATNGGLTPNDWYLVNTSSTMADIIYYCYPTILYGSAHQTSVINQDVYYGNQATGRLYSPGPEVQAIPTSEQVAILQARLELQQQRRVEVTSRAEALLVSSLNPEQAAEFIKQRQFTLHSRDGKRTYIITYGIAGNVFEVERGRAIASYCIHPTGVPTEDVMLAQKLMLETDEESFLKIANRTSLCGLSNPRALAVA